MSATIFARGFAALVLVGLTSLVMGRPALAVPSFARQTGQPCAACHVGAFGPQLTETGREFKLNGYVWNDGSDHLPLAAFVQTSLTETKAGQPGGAAPGFGANDNLAVDQVSVFYAGRITDNLGAFVQTTYNGVVNGFHWDNTDVRYARRTDIGDIQLLVGVTVNNSPTVQDVWNSTPAWGFPFAASQLAPVPGAATLIDGGLAQKVVGAGAYALWNNLVYIEADVYEGLGRDVRNGLGIVPVSGANEIDGAIPYWRVALQHDFGSHYLELGSFGLLANQFPGGDNTTGHSDRIVDTAFDATYLYSGSADHIVTGYATYIHESQALAASRILLGTNASDALTTFRIDGSYSYQNTVTVSAQRFRTRGSSDVALFSNGSPNSSGWIGEIAYVPSGKVGSWFPTWFNPRLSLQYTAYTAFDGSSHQASDNNTLYALLWLAF